MAGKKPSRRAAAGKAESAPPAGAADDDLADLLNGADVAALFLDAELRIRRFTPVAARLLRLTLSDVARPVGETAPPLADADLAADARAVLGDLAPREREIEAEGGRWYVRQVAPHRARDGRTDGVVVTFLDVTLLKQAEAALRRLGEELERRVAERTAALEAANRELQAEVAARRQAEEEVRRLAAIVESSDDAIIGKTLEGVILTWNAGAERLYGYSAAEAVSRPVAMLALPDRPDEIPAILERLRRGEHIEPFKTRRVRKDGREVAVSVSISPLKDAAGRVVGASAIARDVTEQVGVERLLRESREKLRAIVETAADAVVAIDRRGIIESVNPAAESLFGYAAAEMVGANVSMLMPSPYREEHDGYLADYLRTGVRKIIGIGREVRGRRKDGSTFPVDLAVSEVRELGLFTGVLRDVTRRKELEREVLEIAALEQRRIGQDLHDDVGQELTGLALLADALAQGLKDSPAQAEAAARVAAGIGRVHKQIRLLSRGLVPVELDPEGLRAALEDLAARTGEQSGVACTFECTGSPLMADAVAANHLFRIAQEAVSNALRHARARHLRIALVAEGDTLTLSVRDDGVGLPSPIGERAGLGLRLMQNRAGLIGATLTIGPSEGGGTLVTCILSRGNRHG